MAYNLQSLITILEQILDPQQTRWMHDHNKPQLESLLKKAVSLQQILEKPSAPKTESLDSQIRDAAHKAEDIIESCMADQMLSSPEGVSFTFSTPDVQQVMQLLDSIMEQVVKLVDGDKMSSASSSLSAASFSSSKSVVVGVDEDLMQLKDRMIGTTSKLEIIPIVGMGGVGKTTLARELYEDSLIVSRFRHLAWTAVSQNYNLRAILSCLLRCIAGKEFRESVDELKDIMYKSLYGKRYMIVLDDVWNTKFWDDIRRYFPDNNNGSRILLTTRESEVAKYADLQSLQHQGQLLSEPQSWNLLRQIVFGEDDCPHMLQEIGENIASDCGGLPLAINVIGGILCKVQRSKNDWENIAKDVRAAIDESDKQFSYILSLSYNHLPNHLKPCFLYFGAFPEDDEIQASKLIHLYVAEGFLRLTGGKSLEEEAKCCLKALVERNLIFVARKRLNGEPSIYNIHDMLRDVCMRKADEDKFLHVKNPPESTSNMRRVSIHASHGLEDACASIELMPLARSFLSNNDDSLLVREIPSPVFFKLRLLRVLDVMHIGFKEFPREILQLICLRYLAISCNAIPTGISMLCNFQTLVARVGSGEVPSELREKSELRHIMFNTPIGIDDEYMKRFVQKKLQTVSPCVVLTPSQIARGFFESIPYIKSIGILYDDDSSSIALDLTHLHQLESLRFYSYGMSPNKGFLQTLKYPSTIKDLTLDGRQIFPAGLTNLCALPKLEVLNIHRCVFIGEEAQTHEDEFSSLEEFESEEARDEWEAAEGDVFSSLQVLQLKRLNLVRWRADETNFPRLRHLIIKDCPELEEIPSGFGDITTLQIIELEDCSDSAVASAKHIQMVQQSELDDYSLELRIPWD